MPRYTEAEARAAVASSLSYAAALRKLGLRPAGGNHRLFRRYVDEVWGIPTGHFDQGAARSAGFTRRAPVALSEVLVEHSTYERGKLKARLYKEGLKSRRCEMCGQGETWRGRRLSLILDHINGVPDDNRLDNLRIVCPNCNATLDTHCGRKNRLPARNCGFCGREFQPKGSRQQYCSSYCGARHPNRPRVRKVEWPSYEQLQSDVAAMSMLAVGRKYGVSATAVRKWIDWYERQQGDGPGEPAA